MPNPEIVAHFETDEAGKPIFTEGATKRHYKIMVELKDAPEGTYAATFELDPSYYNAVRTLRPDPDGTVRLSLHSYGDYPLKVRVRTTEGEVPLTATLSDALQSSLRAEPPSPEVAEALSYIAAH